MECRPICQGTYHGYQQKQSSVESFKIKELSDMKNANSTAATILCNRYNIPNNFSIAIFRVVESSSSSVITFASAKSAIKDAFLNWCPSATFGDGICKVKMKHHLFFFLLKHYNQPNWISRTWCKNRKGHAQWSHYVKKIEASWQTNMFPSQ